MVVRFIGGENQITQRKPLTCRKSLTNVITGSRKSNYNTITTQWLKNLTCSNPLKCTDLLNSSIKGFCNDLSHNLSFGHLNTHPIIDPNIEKFPKGQHLGHKMKVKTFDFHCILYKDNK
jgi:hypothetical protein